MSKNCTAPITNFQIRKNEMKTETKKIRKGFTLIELLVVVAIIALLASVVMAALSSARGKAYVAAVAQTQREMQKAVELYVTDMGFYPPDTGRGEDPGLAKPLPYNLDNGRDCNTNPGDCPAVCANCPADWIAQVQAKWRGPYIGLWPPTTPWGGEYDFNYWPLGSDRYGCLVPPGIYIGAQGDYNNLHTIPPEAEQELINKKLDNDGCSTLNGESQIWLGSI